ncbi:hypothetical protein, partial [uncultured Cobetia sp.]|uniref:hypothetical protein n=1 Tax=uncultured Cobetia sp. TaxID=410706 RepID=UPI0030EB534F
VSHHTLKVRWPDSLCHYTRQSLQITHGYLQGQGFIATTKCPDAGVHQGIGEKQLIHLLRDLKAITEVA